MPLTSIIALIAIVAAFLLFAVVLAWVDYQTKDRPARKEEAPQGQDRREIRPAA